MAVESPVPEAAVLRCVPHRAPILRVERVLAVEPGVASVAGREPTGPGCLPWAMGAIEGIAQSAAVLLGHMMDPGALDRVGKAAAQGATAGMLVAVKRCVVSGEPAPGAEIVYRVELVRRFGPTALLRGVASSGGRELARAEITLWTATG